MSILPPSDPLNSRLYLDWVRQFDPDATGTAEELVDTLVATYRKSRKPGAFVDQIDYQAKDLPERHRPWLLAMVGQWLTASGDSEWDTRHRTAAVSAYGRARAVEREYSLPVHADYHRENALLFARAGALPSKEVAVHQHWLTLTAHAEEAHRELIRLLLALAEGGAPLGADLHRRVRASAKAAGLGVDEDSRVLRDLFAACTSQRVPDGLLDGAAKVFAQAPPEDVTPLLDLFPRTATDGSALLRMLDATGAIDAMAEGKLLPPAGLAGWISRFFFTYCYVEVSGGGITKQQMPRELFDMIERIGPRLRESGERVLMARGRYNSAYLDADLADALLAVGVGVVGPDEGGMHFWGAKSRRDLVALAADPVLGTQLERVVHTDRETTSTAIVRLPQNPGIERAVHARVVAVIERVAAGGLLDAERALVELDELLDSPTAQALDGIEEALATLDGTGPLLRTLRSGVPSEFHWPAWEDAVTRLRKVRGMTSTWPLLTLYSDDHAVVIGPRGTVAETDFTVPSDARSHVVFYAGGDFLVGYSATAWYSEHAFWTSAPGDLFSPAEDDGMAPWLGGYRGGLGYQFATVDGRHDGERILRPRDRDGVGEYHFQMSDGARVWSLEGYRDGLDRWAEIDPATGVRAEFGCPPDFFTGYDVPAGKQLINRSLSYARLPEGVVSSPLGSSAGMVGYRVLRDHGTWTGYVLEGVDGRRADCAGGRGSDAPWGIAHFPEGTVDVLMTCGSPTNAEFAPMRAYDNGSPLWEMRPDPRQAAALPPPAFWHFLIARDAEGSRTLRGLDATAVRVLLSDGVLPPGIADPALVRGVRGLADRAARLARARDRISQRIATVRSGALVTPPAAAPDSDLLPALLGLLEYPSSAEPAVVSATLTGLAADGRFLAGDIDETVRRLSPPAPPIDWTPLLGHIDAVAWRAINGRTSEPERTALIAFLRTWAAQPFAQPGEWRLGRWQPDREPTLERTLPGAGTFLQSAVVTPPEDATEVHTLTVTRDDAARLEILLDLLSRKGVRTPSEQAVRLFAERTGAREPIARLVLDGLPRRCHFGGGLTSMREAHEKMVRTKPYRASHEVAEQYEQLSRKLGWSGRLRLVAAGIPDDPAELWSSAGDLAAAERMAAVWNELIGSTPHVPEDLTAELAATTELTGSVALALAHPEATTIDTQNLGCRLAIGGNYQQLRMHCGSTSIPLWQRWNPYRDTATALAWALTERPVGDPSVRGATELHDRLQARLSAPKLLVVLEDMDVTAELFGPGTYAGAPAGRTIYDDGLVIVDGHKWSRAAFLRTAALSDPEAPARTLRTCADHGLTELAHAIRCEEALVSGLSSMVARSATTPVAAGRYEADPQQSVPELVEQISASLGVSPDAAALYLQLLTLARPTDRNLRGWNQWTPARHKKAQAELVALRLVVEDKRTRAGRTAFVPGPWTEKLAKPHLPLETAKLAGYLVRPTEGKDIIGPYRVILPPRPLHEMFADAWASRTS